MTGPVRRGTRVSSRKVERRGRIVIEFAGNADDLQRNADLSLSLSHLRTSQQIQPKYVSNHTFSGLIRGSKLPSATLGIRRRILSQY